MKDKKPKLEEIESSLTIGGVGGKTVWRGDGRGEGADATLLSPLVMRSARSTSRRRRFHAYL